MRNRVDAHAAKLLCDFCGIFMDLRRDEDREAVKT